MHFYHLLKLNKAIKSPTLKLIGVWAAGVMGFRHLSVRFDPVLGCNLECRMCYFSNAERRKEFKGRMGLEEIRQMARCVFPQALQVVVGCGAEPTLHKDYVEVVRLAKQYKVPDVSLVTNGLLLQRHDIEKLIEAGLDELIFSMHGVTKPVYEYFMQKGDYDAFVERLGWLSELKRKHGSRSPALRINYTVNADNLDDLHGFFERFGHLDIATLQVRPMFENDGIYHGVMDDGHVERYNELVQRFNDVAKQRHMRLLANTADVRYEQKSKDERVAAAVYCYVSPRTASHLGQSWEQLNFRTFNRLSGRNKSVWRSIFSKQFKFVANIGKSEIV